MSTQPQPAPPPAASGRRRHPWLVGGAVAGALLVLALGLWLWLRPRPDPPLPDLTDVDPEVAELIADARRGVVKAPSARTWGHLGMVFRAHDFAEESNHCFREAERLNPRDARWPYLQGLTVVLTDPEAGIPYLERAVERCGDEPLAPRLRLAEVLLERGRLQEAQSHLEQALGRQPDNLRARLGLGRLALLREQWRAGLEPLAACQEDGHARRLAHTLQAEAWGRLGEAERARAEQDQAAKLPEDERWPDPFVDEVLRLQRGLRARLETADGLKRGGRSEQALELLKDTADKYPRSVKAHLLLGEVYLQLGRPDLAEPSYRHAVQADPDAAEAWFSLGVAQAEDRPREAADSFRRAVRLKPNHAWAHFNLGQMLKKLGDPAGAADEFRAALRCRPDYAAAREALKELKTPGQDKPGKER
jgi:tetratricopeptide (TPR) repeat protein